MSGGWQQQGAGSGGEALEGDDVGPRLGLKASPVIPLLLTTVCCRGSGSPVGNLKQNQTKTAYKLPSLAHFR